MIARPSKPVTELNDLRMIQIKNHFEDRRISHIEGAILQQIASLNLSTNQLKDKEIAITVGSRGIHNIKLIIQTIINELKEYGAKPFIIPAMGSHGGATAEGQLEVLESLGFTEESCGVPIRSSMEVVELGTTNEGVPVFMDKIAYESDGIIIVNRVKKHTDFTSNYESGLCKMSTIGLGNHKMAQTMHSYGVKGLRNHIKECAKVVFDSGKILFGMAIVEDSYDHTAMIEAMPANEILQREPKLLELANDLLPKLPINEIDILVVEQIGKNFSGTGMDTNVIGRINIVGETDPPNPNIRYIIVDDLSEASHGNALGVGLADFTTEKLYKKIDLQKMNENTITTTFLKRAFIPMVLKDVHEAMKVSTNLLQVSDLNSLKIIKIKNTLNLEDLWVSPKVIEEMSGKASFEVISETSYEECFNE
ncbi:lactate racemase domain-containing protein [Ureibacillus sp. NPDC094379]